MFNQKNAITTLLWVAHEGIIFGKKELLKIFYNQKILQRENFLIREIGTVPKFFIRITSSS